MSKQSISKIRDTDDLPDFFEIRNYEHWQGKDPFEAVMAVRDRLHFLQFSRNLRFNSHPAKRTIETALKDLAAASSEPYRRYTMSPWIRDLHYEVRSPRGHSKFRVLDCRVEDRNLMLEKADQEIRNVIGPSFVESRGKNVSLATALDLMVWLSDNKPLLREIKRAAQRLSTAYGWEFKEVQEAMLSRVPLSGHDGSYFVVANGYPSIKANTLGFRQHLEDNGRDQGAASSRRYTNVYRLFKYRIAAYADLMAWCYLTGHAITQRCLVDALYPGRNYDANFLSPTKYIGGFIKELEKGYIDDLVAMASEMDNLSN